jgi:hypothetical protein
MSEPQITQITQMSLMVIKYSDFRIREKVKSELP